LGGLRRESSFFFFFSSPATFLRNVPFLPLFLFPPPPFFFSRVDQCFMTCFLFPFEFTSIPLFFFFPGRLQGEQRQGTIAFFFPQEQLPALFFPPIQNLWLRVFPSPTLFGRYRKKALCFPPLSPPHFFFFFFFLLFELRRVPAPLSSRGLFFFFPPPFLPSFLRPLFNFFFRGNLPCLMDEVDFVFFPLRIDKGGCRPPFFFPFSLGSHFRAVAGFALFFSPPGRQGLAVMAPFFFFFFFPGRFFFFFLPSHFFFLLPFPPPPAREGKLPPAPFLSP